MRFAFAYAGIPMEFYDHVYAEKDTFTGKAQYFGMPFNEHVLAYNSGYIEEFADHFARLISRDHNNALSDTAFAVIAVAHDESSTDILKQAFFPSTYCATVDCGPVWGSKMQRKIAANALVLALREATRKAKRVLTLLGDEVVARSNRTPLLLPVKNFSSKVLEGELRALHNGLSDADDHKKFIEDAIKRINQAHPFARVDDSSKKAFIDDRQITYASPGRDRHAFARPGTGHPVSCILSGKRRLGAPYDHAFHYDCTKAGQAQLKGSFFGCHQPRADVTGNPHLNIAPNDYVRK